MNQTYMPGKLVEYRNREWMVLPSADDELLMLKPLGGSDEEITGIYLPLESGQDVVKEASFPYPSTRDLGNFQTAEMLFDAARLSFRNASGPFRSMGKLSFRPRSYQIIPLVMSLKQDTTRLMIADDVGIGKTVEALIILKELMERGDVKRFAVICPPHLCEQWQQELKDKIDIEAEIIRSSTAASLDRKVPDDRSIFYHLPFQVLSIDYIKTDRRRKLFLNDCPEFVIVDEAHTCALPEGSKTRSQQLRHLLVSEVAQDINRHLLMLTATPHSGKDDEFMSLVRLLNPEFNHITLENITDAQRKKLAKYFVQRKRENIKRWLSQLTNFPERDSKEIPYSLSGSYSDFYSNVLAFARGISRVKAEDKKRALLRSWVAISLIRGVMSSPAMAFDMLNRRLEKLEDDELAIPEIEDTLFEKESGIEDITRKDLVNAVEFEQTEQEQLDALIDEARLLPNLENDYKAVRALKLIKDWLKQGFQPIVFCKFIATANYLKGILEENLPKRVDVRCVTSELADEQRRDVIADIGKSEQRVLVATDCLSEGINLQEHFNAVLHYDLPWNPNRLEQRDGRVDRYGQTAPEIKTYVLYGSNNPMDEFVLEVLVRKVRDIKKATGVSISIGDDAKSIMAKAAEKLLNSESNDTEAKQAKLFADEFVTDELEKARKKGEKLRSIFAQESIKPEKIQEELNEVDEAIGDVETVAEFVTQSILHLGGDIAHDGVGYKANLQNLPMHLRSFFDKTQVQLSFDSPTPRGYRYLGRNHRFVEQLCQFILALAFENKGQYEKVGRVAQIQTEAVSIKTTLVMFRVRNVIKEVNSSREVIAEEMYLWGYEGNDVNGKSLEYLQARSLLQTAEALVNIPAEKQEQDIGKELHLFESMKPRFIDLAEERAENLVKAHGRFKDLVGGRRYEKATPVLPPDVMGVYMLLPKPKRL